MAEATVRHPRRIRVAESVYQRIDKKNGEPLAGQYEFTYRDSRNRQVWEKAATRTEARQKRAEIIARQAKGEKVERTNLTVSDAAALWLERGIGRRGPWDANTKERYESVVRLHINQSPDLTAPAIGQKRLTQLAVDDVAAWTRQMQQRHSGSYAKLALSVLNQSLKLAVRNGWLASNPVTKLETGERPRSKAKPVLILDTQTVRKLIEHAPSPTWARFIGLLAYSGLRISEARGLRWKNIDFDQNLIRVREQLTRKKKAKAGGKTDSATRDVAISGRLGTVLKEHWLAADQDHKSDNDLVFAGPLGDGYDYTTAWRHFKQAADSAGVEAPDGQRLSPHVLRHYFASLLIGQGLSVVYVSKQLGHADGNITLSTYAHLFDQADQATQARAALDQAQSSAGSGASDEVGAASG